MADIVYRANLKASSFPFLSELQGQSVIVKQSDQNYVSGLAAKESLDTAMGVPQIYYCHNVIPTDNGYKTVGYDQYTAADYPSSVGFNSEITLRDGAGNSAQFAFSDLGNVYIMPAGASSWSIPLGAPSAASIMGKRMTSAFVSGVTYIYFSNVGCYTYDWGTNTLSLVTLTGLVAADVLGIAGNSGYLIAYSESAIAWSSTIDPTDLVPSLATGAGGGAVEGARGAIVTIESVYGGMIVFTESNAVAAISSSNPRYPYNFIEITGCGGLVDPSYASYDANSGALYAYTTSGLQQITVKKATSVFPELTDFLSGSIIEDFDENTFEFILTDTSGSSLLKRIAVIADRYIIISYGASSLTHAIYYDTALKQFGKLRIEHTDCFEFQQYTAGTVEVPKKSIAFLGAGGSIHILNSDILNTNSSGIMVLGKYQYIRQRTLQLQGFVFENVNSTDTLNVYDLATLDGKTFLSPQQGYLMPMVAGAKVREYKFHNIGINHSLLCIGAFNAVSAVLTFNIAGGR